MLGALIQFINLLSDFVVKGIIAIVAHNILHANVPCTIRNFALPFKVLPVSVLLLFVVKQRELVCKLPSVLGLELLVRNLLEA